MTRIQTTCPVHGMKDLLIFRFGTCGDYYASCGLCMKEGASALGSVVHAG